MPIGDRGGPCLIPTIQSLFNASVLIGDTGGILDKINARAPPPREIRFVVMNGQAKPTRRAVVPGLREY
jgi:hypothetical protein